MRRTGLPNSGKHSVVAPVCRIWRMARATVHRHCMPGRTVPLRRPGPTGPPTGPMPEAKVPEAITWVLDDSPLHGEGHRTVWAQLFRELDPRPERELRLGAQL